MSKPLKSPSVPFADPARIDRQARQLTVAGLTAWQDSDWRTADELFTNAGVAWDMIGDPLNASACWASAERASVLARSGES